jgi:hypothetical protein
MYFKSYAFLLTSFQDAIVKAVCDQSYLGYRTQHLLSIDRRTEVIFQAVNSRTIEDIIMCYSSGLFCYYINRIGKMSEITCQTMFGIQTTIYMIETDDN